MAPDNPKDKAITNSEAPTTNTGNASNTGPEEKDQKPDNQLLHKKAEKYLRESGNIEDLPDAADQAEADEIIKKEKHK